MFLRSWATPLGLLALASGQDLIISDFGVCDPNSSVVLHSVKEVIRIIPVVINQYIGSNTVININGGVTINVNNAPTNLALSTVATVTETQTITTTVLPGLANAAIQSDLPFQFVLQVAAPAVRARQVQFAGSYLAADGTLQHDPPSDTKFSLNNGQLSVENNGLAMFFTRTSSASFAPFVPTSTIPGTSVFGGVSGTLQWRDATFSGGLALFCTSGGIVQAVFDGDYPADCEPVGFVFIDVNNLPDVSSFSSVSSSTTDAGQSALNIITSQGLQSFCSDYIGSNAFVATETATSTVTRTTNTILPIPTSTTTVLETTSASAPSSISTVLTFDFVTTTIIVPTSVGFTTVTISTASTIIGLKRRATSVTVPAPLLVFPTSIVSSACANAIDLPVSTTTFTALVTTTETQTIQDALIEYSFVTVFTTVTVSSGTVVTTFTEPASIVPVYTTVPSTVTTTSKVYTTTVFSDGMPRVTIDPSFTAPTFTGPIEIITSTIPLPVR